MHRAKEHNGSATKQIPAKLKKELQIIYN